MTESVETPARQLARFMAEYEPRIATIAKGAMRRLRKLMPGAVDAAPVRALLKQAKDDADAPFSGKRRMIIKLAMAKRRARRPGEKLSGAKAELMSREAWKR